MIIILKLNLYPYTCYGIRLKTELTDKWQLVSAAEAGALYRRHPCDVTDRQTDEDK